MRSTWLIPLLLLAGCPETPANDDLSVARDMAVRPADLARAAPDLSSTDLAMSTCMSGVKDGDESDVDCGGACPPCAAGKACGKGDDCTTGFCRAKSCTAAFVAPSINAVGTNPVALAIGDWNGDGKLDVATANQDSDDTSVLLGRGDATLQDQKKFTTTGVPTDVERADLDKDGKLDLLVTLQKTSEVKNGLLVLLGVGDGTFKAPAPVLVGAQPAALVVGNLAGDGNVDAIVLNNFSGDLSVLSGNGNGTFAGVRNLTTAGKSTGLAIADFNDDKKLDVAVGNTDVYTHFGDGVGSLYSPGQKSTGTGGCDECPLAAGDLNNDKFPDLVAGGAGSYAILLNNGNGTFTTKKVVRPGGALSVALADLDGDGNLDLALVDGSDVIVSAGRGDGTFARGATYLVPGANTRAVAAADLDGNNRPELIVTDKGMNRVAVLKNVLP